MHVALTALHGWGTMPSFLAKGMVPGAHHSRPTRGQGLVNLNSQPVEQPLASFEVSGTSQTPLAGHVASQHSPLVIDTPAGTQLVEMAQPRRWAGGIMASLLF